jgi:hypothetical protein
LKKCFDESTGICFDVVIVLHDVYEFVFGQLSVFVEKVSLVWSVCNFDLIASFFLLVGVADRELGKDPVVEGGRKVECGELFSDVVDGFLGLLVE